MRRCRLRKPPALGTLQGMALLWTRAPSTTQLSYGTREMSQEYAIELGRAWSHCQVSPSQQLQDVQPESILSIFMP